MESIRPIMNGCTETDKPLISILMAVYEPNLQWLREQLLSLNEQTYPNLRLYIRDDCSPTVAYAEIQSCVQDCISAFPVFFSRNDTNLGSNLTFQQLTLEAEGDYFAYCDQDDVWLKEKVTTLVDKAVQHGALLVCSNMAVINGQGTVLASSITQLRPRHVFASGEHLEGKLLYRNFVTGCTMLVSAPMAKEACPFAKTMIHDHYLALYAALHGSIYSCPTPLIQYRIHEENQTGVLHKIQTKEDYAQKHMGLFIARIEELSQRFSFPELTLAKQWTAARQENWQRKPFGFYHLWKLRKVNLSTSYFELVGLKFPNWLFKLVVTWIQDGKI